MTISATTQGLRPGVCLSTSRPATPFEGQLIYETDTDSLAVYDGSSWVRVNPVDRDRNVIINGAMQVAQRGTSVTGITSGSYNTADRWRIGIASALGTWTNTVENDAPTGSGFRKSLKFLCTSGTSAGTAGLTRVEQLLEGQNLQKFKKGTASAERLTASFWVKSNVTGTYILNFEDTDNSRIVSASYSISSADTWEKKTLTFPADTTGAFDNDNLLSMRFSFVLGAGTNFTSGTLQTTWASITEANRAVGQVNAAATTNNYWQVTGVQLEVGSVATPFEFEDCETTLSKCQRYYYRQSSGSGKTICTAAAYSTTANYGVVPFPVTMRDTPVAVVTNATNHFRFVRSGGAVNASTLAIQEAHTNGATVYGTFGSSTTGDAGWIITDNASAYLDFNSEL